MIMVPTLVLSFFLFSLPLLVWAVLEKKTIYSKQWSGPSPIWYTRGMMEHSKMLMRSYQEKTGLSLLGSDSLSDDEDAACRHLFFHPQRVILSHGIQKYPEGPILNYGNNYCIYCDHYIYCFA